MEAQLSDLNQAGQKPANQVRYISHRKDDNGIIQQSKVSIKKNRNGATMEFPVRFLGDRMLFTNPARESEEAFKTPANEFYDDGNDSPPEWAKE